MTYTINGKEYKSKRFDFAALVKFEECGINMSDLQNLKNLAKPLTLIVAVCAWVMDCDKETATKEINSHIENGGSLEDCTKILESLKDSDFFQKAMKQN